MVILPGDYAQHTVHELLSQADQGLVAFDHRLLRVLLDDMPGVAQYANERMAGEGDIHIAPDLVQLFSQRPMPEAAGFLAFLAGELRDDVPEDLIEALARVGKPALEPLLAVYEKYRGDEPGDLASAIAFVRTPDPRADAIFAEQGEEEAEFLRDIASGPAETEPFDIFTHYPETALPDLMGQPLEVRREFLASSERTYRLAALATFLDTELPASMARHLEQIAREDADAEVRGVAWEALEPAAKNNPQLQGFLRERLRDAKVEPIERAGLAVALASAPDAEFTAAVKELWADKATRARALQAMWRSFDRGFAPFAVESLADPDAEVREQAILATGYLNITSEASRIEKLFQDDEHRDSALFAYALCAPSEVTRARMRQVFRSIEKLAGGFSIDDAATVEQAIDLRLEMHGLEPLFAEDDGHEHHDGPREAAAPAPAKAAGPGRNDPCPCGSGKKFKKCHGA